MKNNEMYLVDGHNLIGSGAIPSIRLDQEDDEERLVSWLRVRQPRLGKPIVVVFDSGVPGGLSRGLSGGGVTVIFAARRRARADAIILRRVREERPAGHVIVVTNDAVLREAVRGLGARVISANEFVHLAQTRPVRGRKKKASSQLKLEPKPSQKEIDEWLALFGQREEEE